MKCQRIQKVVNSLWESRSSKVRLHTKKRSCPRRILWPRLSLSGLSWGRSQCRTRCESKTIMTTSRIWSTPRWPGKSMLERIRSWRRAPHTSSSSSAALRIHRCSCVKKSTCFTLWQVISFKKAILLLETLTKGLWRCKWIPKTSEISSGIRLRNFRGMSVNIQRFWDKKKIRMGCSWLSWTTVIRMICKARARTASYWKTIRKKSIRYLIQLNFLCSRRPGKPKRRASMVPTSPRQDPWWLLRKCWFSPATPMHPRLDKSLWWLIPAIYIVSLTVGTQALRSQRISSQGGKARSLLLTPTQRARSSVSLRGTRKSRRSLSLKTVLRSANPLHALWSSSTLCWWSIICNRKALLSILPTKRMWTLRSACTSVPSARSSTSVAADSIMLKISHPKRKSNLTGHRLESSTDCIQFMVSRSTAWSRLKKMCAWWLQEIKAASRAWRHLNSSKKRRRLKTCWQG